jgi:hypothetical protein
MDADKAGSCGKPRNPPLRRVSSTIKGPGLRHQGLKEAELAPAVADVRYEET